MSIKYWTKREEEKLKKLTKKYRTKKGVDWKKIKKYLRGRSINSLKVKLSRIKNRTTRKTKRTIKIKKLKQIKKKPTRTRKIKKLKVKLGRKYINVTDDIKVKMKKRKKIKTISEKIKKPKKKKRTIKELKKIYKKERKKRKSEIKKREKKEIKKQKKKIKQIKKEEIEEHYVKLIVAGHIDDYGKKGHEIWLKATISVIVPERLVDEYKTKLVKRIMERLTSYFGYAPFLEIMTFGYEIEPTNETKYREETEFEYSHNGVNWVKF